MTEPATKKPAEESEAEEKKQLPVPPNRRAKCPTVLQMEAVECGAAALKIVLGYYGRIVPLEELRIECGVSRDGSKANNVLKAARRYGLIAKGYKHGLEALFDLQFPVILFWNFNHFLVLEGFKKGQAYLMNPAGGPEIVTMEDLDASFSGVVLTFEPGPDFEKGGQDPSIMAALRRRLIGSETALVFALLCGLFLVIPGLVIPTFTRVFIDEYLVAGRTLLVKPLLIGMAITALMRGALTYLQEYYLLRLETKLALVHATAFFNHIIRLPVAYFGQRFAGEIGSRVLINNNVAKVISGELTKTIIDCGLIIFYGVLMMLYDVTLTLVCIFLALLNIAAVKAAGRKRIDSARRLMQEDGKLVGTAMGGLQMIETMKATGSEPEFFGRWAGYQAKSLSAEQDLGELGNYVNAVPPLVNTVTTAIILMLGGLKVMNGELTVGMLVAYQSLMKSFIKPLNTFVGFGGMIQELEADMNRLDDVLEYPQDVRYTREKEPDPRTKGVVKLSGKVELRDIVFGYNPLEKPLIENFNLTIEPGQRVALVGSSGSGKSTIARLITGLFQVWEGEILFDDIPKDAIPSGLLTNSLAVVDQDIFLFGGTLRENITMWDVTIPPVTVATAARDAAIAEVIEQREGTYDSLVAEGGGNFSGGQAQRLEIARSLVGSPTLLILDEATSALDPTTERIIDDSLRRRGCTAIVVAHRLSTIRDCDEIIVLDRGKIIQRGTHLGMKDLEGPYARLIQE